jgi:hypothetical protein
MRNKSIKLASWVGNNIFWPVVLCCVYGDEHWHITVHPFWWSVTYLDMDIKIKYFDKWESIDSTEKISCALQKYAVFWPYVYSSVTTLSGGIGFLNCVILEGSFFFAPPPPLH